MSPATAAILRYVLIQGFRQKRSTRYIGPGKPVWKVFMANISVGKRRMIGILNFVAFKNLLREGLQESARSHVPPHNHGFVKQLTWNSLLPETTCETARMTDAMAKSIVK